MESRSKILKRIGCIVEKPDFYLYLSAKKNLELFGKLSGIIPSKNKIAELIELVGLKGREEDKVKTYSHGMKQRLGIAQTLIHDPELIILDEPTTGLDPQGIIDVRQLILRLKMISEKRYCFHLISSMRWNRLPTEWPSSTKGKRLCRVRLVNCSHHLI